MKLRESLKQWLQRQGCDTNRGNSLQHKAILMACDKESTRRLNHLVEDGIDINTTNSRRDTALHVICQSNKFNDQKTKRMVEMLLKFDPDLNAENDWCETPLLNASHHGKVRVVELLIKHGADLTATNMNGKNALDLAILNCQTKVAEVLLPKFFNDKEVLNGPSFVYHRYWMGRDLGLFLAFYNNGFKLNSEHGGTAFAGACIKPRFDIIRFFLQNGFDPDIHCKKALEITPHEDVFMLLLQHRDAMDIEIDKYFIQACQRGFVKAMQYLSELAVDNDFKISDHTLGCGITAACMTAQLESVKWLLGHGADVNFKHAQCGVNALTMVEYSTSGIDVFKYLISKGIDVNVANKYGETPFMAACGFGRLEFVELLLKAGADIQRKDRVGRPALILTCLKSDLLPSEQAPPYNFNPLNTRNKIAQLLIHHGANVNTVDQLGRTAIMYAIEDSSMDEVFQLLVDKGADLGIIDNRYMDLFSIAMSSPASNLEILLNTGVLTENGRLKPKYYQREFDSIPYHKNIKKLIELGIFEWELCVSMAAEALCDVIDIAMVNGICPPPANLPLLPFALAIKVNSSDLFSRITTKSYFYPEDYKYLLLNFKEYLKLNDLTLHLTHQPMSLYKWSLITVSKLISLTGSPCSRTHRVNKLHVPSTLKNDLLFKMEYDCVT